MSTNSIRTAIYLRVSRDDQTTENQRLVLARVAEHRFKLTLDDETHADPRAAAFQKVVAEVRS